MLKNISRRDLLATGLTAAALPLIGTKASAQTSWPTKPIRIIAGFAAGGQTDLFARTYGDQIAKATGQTVIVDNKAGGNGVIAAMELKRSAPDGYTMMFTNSTPVIMNRVLLKDIPYDTDKDFTIVSMMPTGSVTLVAAAKTGATNLKEFIEYAKKNDKVSIGTYAAGSFAHIAITELNKQYGLKMEAVHYRGEAPMFADLAGGSLDAGVGSYGAGLAVTQSGRGKVIAVARSRMSVLPEVGTYMEQGANSRAFQLLTFQCCAVPIGTPRDVVSKIADLLVAAGKSDKIKEMNKTFGIDEGAMTFDATQKVYKDETPVWLDLVSSLGLKPE